MAVKAVAMVKDIGWEGASTFKVEVRYVALDANDIQGQFELTGQTGGILSAVFEQNIKDAVKDQLGLGLLDTVRLIGSTI